MNTVSRCKPLLGTYVEISLSGALSRTALIELSNKAFAEIESIHQQMSFHNVDSNLSFINRYASQKWCDLTKDLQTVIEEAVRISRLSQGVFDITIASQLVTQGELPDYDIKVDQSADWQDIEINQGKIRFNKPLLIDLGGIAKGYAVDKALSTIDKDIDVVINAGGDIRMNQWQDKTISIRFGAEDKSQFIETEMFNAALATSSDYYLENTNVIISPDTKTPIDSEKTYSVFADNCMLADALTKLAFLLEPDFDIIDQFGAELISIEPDGSISIH